MFKIGNIEIKNQVVMAPMAGITNMAFRKIIKDFGAGLVYSEMVSDKALCYGNTKTIDMLQVDDGEHPVSIQLFGGEVETMVKAAKFIDQHSNCDIIDINMGCPVNKVLKADAGSKLLLYPDKIYEIVKGIVDNVSKPVTVKIRSGFDSKHINAVEVAKLIEKAGASAIAIHGRTRSQMYEGKADWKIIADVKAAVKIPVIGNGDVRSVEDAKRMLEETKCDAVMIGRGVLGNPWLIRDCIDFLNGKEIKEVTILDKLNMVTKHLNYLLEFKPEKLAILEMRTQIGYYLKGISKDYKQRFMKVTTKEEFIKLVGEVKNEYCK